MIAEAVGDAGRRQTYACWGATIPVGAAGLPIRSDAAIFREWPHLALPAGASLSCQPTSVRLQIVATSPAPPDGEGWLHEIKHDGRRLIAIIGAGGRLSLISRNGYDRTAAFAAPFAPLAAPGTNWSSTARSPCPTIAASCISIS
jgi:hypothetical protein